MSSPTPTTETRYAAGAILTAGSLLLLAGAWQAFLGLVALFKDADTVLLVGPKWTFSFDVTAWGWIHLLIGAALFVVGIFVLRGALWAAVVGMIIAGISALANFLWLPVLPGLGDPHHRARRVHHLGARDPPGVDPPLRQRVELPAGAGRSCRPPPGRSGGAKT